MKAKELRIMNEVDLEKKITDLKKELMKINSQIAIGTLPKSPGKVRDIKRTIATILTMKKLELYNITKQQSGGDKKE